MARALPTPQQAAQKLIDRLSTAGQYIQQGVMAVTTSPTEAAANASAQWFNGIQDAYNSKRWENSLRKVSLQQWQQAFINKGLPRIATGINAAKPKLEAFFTNFFPQLDQVRSQVSAMPKGSYEQRKARANTFMDSMHALKGKLKN